MPTNSSSDRFLIRAYLRDDRERGIAKNIFQEVNSDDTKFYSGAAEGWVTSDGLARLMREHIVVDSLETFKLAPPPERAESTKMEDAVAQDDTTAESAGEAEDHGRGFPDRFPIPRRYKKILIKTHDAAGNVWDEVAADIKSAAKHAIDDAKLRAAELPAVLQTQISLKGKEIQTRLCERLEEEANKFIESRVASAGPLLAGANELLVPDQQLYEIEVELPLQPQRRDEITRIGGQIVSYVPPNVFRMFLTPEELTRIKSLPFVVGVDHYGIDKTLTASLMRAIVEKSIDRLPHAVLTSTEADPAQPPPAAAPREFDAVLHRESDRDTAKAAIIQLGGKLTAESATVLRFSAPADTGMLAALANRPEIKCLAAYQPPQLNSDQARKLSGIEEINKGGAAGKYDGSGELVAIFDSGIDDTHPDFVGRIQESVAYKMGNKSGTKDDHVGHGTHVAGIIAGTGAASNGALHGMAPGAKILMFGIVTEDTFGNQVLLTPPDLGDLLKEAVSRGAKIINLSWGSPLGGSYDQGARQLDEFIYRNPEVLVVVAAGNEGKAPAGIHMFNTVGTPASAKNVITVGACGSGHNVARTYATFMAGSFAAPVAALLMADPDLPAALGSRGPTDYDSVKPDVSACGVYVLAPKAANASGWKPPFDNFGGHYMYLGGTSMATPVVSGLAALVRQYLRVERGVAAPTAALVKAILIASAERSRQLTAADGGPYEDRVGYPDFHQGFGRVDLSRLLPHDDAPADRKLLFDDVGNQSDRALFSHSLQGGQVNDTRVYRVTITSGADPLRVVLTWTDFPGNSIQNNLNVYIDGPDGSVIIGNREFVFKRDPIFENAGRQGVPFDKLNNVEQIKINSPSVGQYTIRVVAQSTPMAHQGYALCVAGCIQESALA